MHPSPPVARLLLPALLLPLCLLVSNCTTTSASLGQQIYAADQAVTTIVNSTDTAYNAKLLTKQQAQSVSAIAHQVNPLLDSARAALAINDTAGASKTLTLVNSLLASLKAYMPANTSSSTNSHP